MASSNVTIDRDVLESHYMDWLRDAHAMEQQAETMLTAMAERIENYPDLKIRVEQHIQETREQASSIAACIDRLGGDTSVLKDLVGKAIAGMQSATGMFASDDSMVNLVEAAPPSITSSTTAV